MEVKDNSRKLLLDTYVNDGTTGGTKEEVKRFVGELVDGKYSGTIQQILGLGGFKIKTMVASGCTDENAIHLLGNSVLGYEWDARNDMMSVRIKVNLSKKKKKISEHPDLKMEDLEKLKKIKLTKRNLLSFTAGIFDPLGIALPYTIKLRISLKQIFDMEGLNWDEEISENAKEWWIDVLTEALKAELVRFPRSVKSDEVIGSPLLIGFFDGALPAFSASVYVRWETKDQEATVKLLCAKAKINNGYTVPKTELNGAVLLSRVVKSAVRAMVDKPRSVVCAGDSSCVLSSLETTVARMKPFFHNRVSEVKQNLAEVERICPVESFYHISGKLNPADLATRDDGKLIEIGPESEWQSPTFLKLPREDWPLTRDFERSGPPNEELRLKAFGIFSSLQITPLTELWKIVSNV